MFCIKIKIKFHRYSFIEKEKEKMYNHDNPTFVGDAGESHQHEQHGAHKYQVQNNHNGAGEFST